MKKYISAFAFCAFAFGAQAQDKAVNFEAPLIDLDGKVIEIMTKAAADGKPAVMETMTLGMAAYLAINNQPASGAGAPTPEQKYQDALLAQKIYKHKAVLTVGELAKLKDLIGKTWPPVYLLSAYPMLDPSLAANADDALKAAGTNKTVKDIETHK